MSLNISVYRSDIQIVSLYINVALSAGLRTSWLYLLQESETPHQKTCNMDDTKLNQLEKFLFWGSGEWGPFICSIYSHVHFNLNRGCPCGVMVKAMDCGIVVSEFVLQSRYYVHFRANTLRKGMNPLILPAMG